MEAAEENQEHSSGNGGEPGGTRAAQKRLARLFMSLYYINSLDVMARMLRLTPD
ncbi:hypothetical protein DSO57_1002261 [Entomophthora muscae]|uniref:Uncharacterized protein n=1 Tax=Entomophthora muscae TaxID=34485 RepID=A0ACC2TKE2_9FUNG|nr:hypothetical protein DSO57_1002261 [Entomophthora muscae]